MKVAKDEHPNSKLHSWEDLRVLLEISRQGSFQAAAERLNVATSTIARRVSLLEQSLGRTLVQRTSRGTRIEPDAMGLVNAAAVLEQQLISIGHSEDQTTGRVRLSMGEGFVVPATKLLANLQNSHPGLRIEVIAESRLASIARREADIALRKARSKEAHLVQKKLGIMHFGLFGSRTYLKYYDQTRSLSPHELVKHQFVGYDESGSDYPQSRFLVDRGVTSCAFRSNSDAALIAAAEQGLGLILLGRAHGYPPPPSLVPVAYQGRLPEVPLYLVWRSELSKTSRIKLVASTLERALRKALSSPK